MARKIIRIVGILALLSGLVFLGWFVAAKAGWLAPDRAEVVERYADAPSQFMEIDGVPMHVRVEGKEDGYPLLMLHGSIVNLHEWDPTVERMKDDYRIVRVDWPPYGLSGPNPRGYTTAEAARLVGLVLDELGIEKTVVISTSNGANVALALNEQSPEKVAGMAFSIIPLERPSQTREVDWKIRMAAKFHEAVLPNYHPRIFYEWMFNDTGHEGWVAPDALPQMVYDMNNLPGATPNQKSYIADNVRLFQTTDVGAIAEKVTVPVLLQWCWEDTVISQGPQPTIDRFTNTEVTVVEYDHVGHWPMWEIPDLFVEDIRTFLDANGFVTPVEASSEPASAVSEI